MFSKSLNDDEITFNSIFAKSGIITDDVNLSKSGAPAIRRGDVFSRLIFKAIPLGVCTSSVKNPSKENCNTEVSMFDEIRLTLAGIGSDE
jgi:hypothetical protein